MRRDTHQADLAAGMTYSRGQDACDRLRVRARRPVLSGRDNWGPTFIGSGSSGGRAAAGIGLPSETSTVRCATTRSLAVG